MSKLQPFSIRSLQTSDLPALKRVIDGTGLFASQMLDDMVAPFFAASSSEEIWLTLNAPAPVAIAYCAPERMTEGTSNLLLIAVDPDRQGQGLGAALVVHVEGLLRERGQRILLVETSGLPEFERTRSLYQKLGYDVEARIRGYYRTGDDKIIFRKGLSELVGDRQVPLVLRLPDAGPRTHGDIP